MLGVQGNEPECEEGFGYDKRKIPTHRKGQTISLVWTFFLAKLSKKRAAGFLRDEKSKYLPHAGMSPVIICQPISGRRSHPKKS